MGEWALHSLPFADHQSAYECYRKALELDPDNQSYQNNLEIAEQKLKEEATAAGFNAGSAGGMGGAFGNMDFARIFNDPNILNMATTMMANPQVQEMMGNLMGGQGGPPPDFANLLGGGGQQPGDAPGANLSSLLQASQQMAASMQQANPELVENLRQQMRRENPDGNGSNPSEQQPPQ